MVVMAVDHVPPWRSDMDRVQDGAKHLAEGPERGGTVGNGGVVGVSRYSHYREPCA